MRAEGVLAKFAIARLYGHFTNRGLQHNVVQCLHFKSLVVKRRSHLSQGVFCGLLSGGLSPGRNFAEFQKMRTEGVLAKFAIARLYGHFRSRGLKQNVVECCYFKCIVIRRWWHYCQGVFCIPISGGLSPGLSFAEFHKMGAAGVLAKFAIARLYGHFGSCGVQQNVVQCWHFKCILIGG